MNFPFFIARRYLFAKKSHNVINVISAISASGIMLASFALICTLSVFNGFHDLVENLFRNFDPELKVVSSTHKFFSMDDERIRKAQTLDFIELYSYSLEEQALITYKSKQHVIMIKGVEDSFHDLAGIDNLLRGAGTPDSFPVTPDLIGGLECLNISTSASKAASRTSWYSLAMPAIPSAAIARLVDE